MFRDGARSRNVCALCEQDALARGWLREGAPEPPPSPVVPKVGLRDRLRRGRGGAPVEVGPERPAPQPPSSVVRIMRDGESDVRRSREREAARAEAAALAVSASLAAFNASSYRRTVHGIARTLGRPRISILPLGGTHPDVVISVVWDLSWYQYRVDPGADAPVTLQGRGDDLDELDPQWRSWNGELNDVGELVLVHPSR